MKRNLHKKEIVEIINNCLMSRRQEAIQIGIDSTDVGSYYESRTDIVADDTIKDIIKLERKFTESISVKCCKASLNPILVQVMTDDRNFTEDDLNSFINMLITSRPLDTITVLKPIYGFQLTSEYLKLGEFTIYSNDSKELRDLINPVNNRIQMQCKPFDGFLTKCDVIRIDVVARDADKANDIANKCFRSFDYVTAFFINDFNSSYNFGVYTYSNRTINTNLAIKKSDNSFLSSSTFHNHPNTLIFDEELIGQVNSYQDIWLLIMNTNKTELQTRILGAIEWIGKALNEEDIAKSFVMYMFALETLLQYDEKSMMNPSITHQLSESLAFLLCTDYEDRTNAIKLVKDLYGQRSAIVHGGDSKVDPSDLKNLNVISSSAVWAFLTNPELSKLSSFKEFNNWINYKKFYEPPQLTSDEQV